MVMNSTMKNADMPAMPIGEQIDTCHLNSACNGLSKREYFAGLAMQGFLASNGNRSMRNSTPSMAVEYADDLLTELDKPGE
jgi:hypothetical protein